MNDHARLRESTAAYVLGALHADDRAAFERHLFDCEKCQQDVAAFAPLPGLLNRSGIDEEAAPAPIADLATEKIAEEWRALDTSRRRWRWATGVAAVLLLVALIMPAIARSGDARGTSVALGPDSSATGSVLITDKPWGTAVLIEVSNLPPSETYVAWAVSIDGRWEQMATWGPTPSLTAKVSGASSIATGELDRIVITAGDRTNTVGVAGMNVTATG